MRNVRRKVGVAGAQSLLLRLVFVFLFHFSGFWNERLESEEAKDIERAGDMRLLLKVSH